VLGVGAVGPSGRKPEYANYGRERIAFAAPGGWLADDAGPGGYGNLILSTFPGKVLQEVGLVDRDGAVLPSGAGLVFRYCDGAGRCGYAVYQSGTSMAAPFVTAVAALVVGRYGHPDPRHRGGLTLAPDRVRSILERSAARHACPTPRLVSYPGRGAEWDALCEGGRGFNGFYGHGLIDAYAAVSPSRWK
jgi:lantibiotic leader peptide-processing serine protease